MPEIDLKKLREPIPIEQVEFRVQSISKNGWATMLAYKDARVDMDRLDAVLGSDNWECEYEEILGDLFCKVGIRTEADGEWVWKQDVGKKFTTEPEKARASDAFKRACFKVGIGRELYDYPLLLVQLNEEEFYMDGDKAKASYDLKLKDWVWHSKRSEADDNGKTSINELIAVDERGNERFRYPRTNQPAASKQPSQSQKSSSSSSQSDEKPWYDDFEKEKANLQAMVNKGAKPDELVKHLRKTFKVNTKVDKAILAMRPEAGATKDFDNFDDDIPF